MEDVKDIEKFDHDKNCYDKSDEIYILDELKK